MGHLMQRTHYVPQNWMLASYSNILGGKKDELPWHQSNVCLNHMFSNPNTGFFGFRMFSPYIYLIFADITSEKTEGNIQYHVTQIYFQKTSQSFRKGCCRKTSICLWIWTLNLFWNFRHREDIMGKHCGLKEFLICPFQVRRSGNATQ